MPTGAVLDPPQRSAATVGAMPMHSIAFGDATVGQPFLADVSHPDRVGVQMSSRGGRTLISSVSVTSARPPSPNNDEKVHTFLNQLNRLLARGATVESDAVDPAVVQYALPLIYNAVEEAAVTEVFPLSDGGLLFRWHTSRGSVEAEFDSDGDAVVMVEDRVHGRRAGYWAELWPIAMRSVTGTLNG